MMDEIASRRTEVAEWRVRGLSQTEIAKRVGMSPVTVMKDLKAIRVEWAKRRDVALSEHISETLAVFDAVEKVAWSWKELIRTWGKDENGKKALICEIVERPDLDKVLRARVERAKILGFYQPEVADILARMAQMQSFHITLVAPQGYDIDQSDTVLTLPADGPKALSQQNPARPDPL
jgi:transcriptional regulator with XRE-family HTH domain